MSEVTFEQAYPYAERAARSRARAAVRKLAIAAADREDLEQEAIVGVWRALPHFDPARASLRTFVEHVVANRVTSLLRSRRRQPKFQPIGQIDQPSAISTLALDSRIAVWQLLKAVRSDQREVLYLLTECSIVETSRHTGVSRTSLYRLLGHLRAVFEKGGFNGQEDLANKC